MIRVAIYARVSTGGQTTENQLRELRAVSERLRCSRSCGPAAQDPWNAQSRLGRDYLTGAIEASSSGWSMGTKGLMNKERN
jgi:DNA invertase Pin-like site-specific DNA recombinase